MTQQYGSGGGISVRLMGPFGGSGVSARVKEIQLSESGWKGAVSPYAQVTAVEGISINSKVDLQPTAEQLRRLNCILTAENDGGTVTVYAVGEKPAGDIALQVTLTEVVA